MLALSRQVVCNIQYSAIHKNREQRLRFLYIVESQRYVESQNRIQRITCYSKNSTFVIINIARDYKNRTFAIIRIARGSKKRNTCHFKTFDSAILKDRKMHVRFCDS